MPAREDDGVPTSVRAQVLERDAHSCRVCGRYVEMPALHHTNFGGDARGMGGRRVHDPDFLITVGWLPGHDCHLGLLHAHKRRFQELSWEVVRHPGVSILQLERWRQGGRMPAPSARPRAPVARPASVLDQIRERVVAGESPAQIACELHLDLAVVDRIIGGLVRYLGRQAEGSSPCTPASDS